MGGRRTGDAYCPRHSHGGSARAVRRAAGGLRRLVGQSSAHPAVIPHAARRPPRCRATTRALLGARGVGRLLARCVALVTTEVVGAPKIEEVEIRGRADECDQVAVASAAPPPTRSMCFRSNTWAMPPSGPAPAAPRRPPRRRVPPRTRLPARRRG